jgi:hypothetical protein
MWHKLATGEDSGQGNHPIPATGIQRGRGGQVLYKMCHYSGLERSVQRLFRARKVSESSENHRPCESGAEATAIQTLARWREACEPRAALGVRRVYRRFCAQARSASHRKSIARTKNPLLKPPQRSTPNVERQRARVGLGRSSLNV